MSRFILLRIIPVFLLLFSLPLYGKRRWLETPYVKFDIGENWTCKSFGVSWLCHHYLQKGKNPAIIIATASEGSGSDKPELYIKVFRQIQTVSLEKSRIQTIKVRKHPWIDSFQGDGFVPDMFSRYVATVCCEKSKEKFHIIVSFYAHKEVYTKYANQFLRSIKSLELAKNVTKTLERIRKHTDQDTRDMMSYLERILYESDSEGAPALENNKSGSRFLTGLLIFGFILLCSAFYFLYYRKIKRRRREESRARKRKSRSKKTRRK